MTENVLTNQSWILSGYYKANIATNENHINNTCLHISPPRHRTLSIHLSRSSPNHQLKTKQK